MRHAINVTEYLDETIRDPEVAGRVAVRENDRELTFRELHDRAVRIAAFVQEQCHGSVRNIIAVMMPKSIESIVLDLAILYSGNAYLNLDTKNPDERLNSIFMKTVPAFAICDQQSMSRSLGIRKVTMAEAESAQGHEQVPLNKSRIIDVDPLCVITTSGSTGIPKAVMLTHRGLIDYMEEIIEERLVTGAQVIGSLSPAYFDHHCFEIVQMCALGSTIDIISPELAAFPPRLVQKLGDDQVSFIFWVPTIMVNIANLKLLDDVCLPSLKTVWFAGETFLTSKFNYWRQRLPQASFVNLYGPTEISVDCTYHKVVEELADDDVIPIGKAFRNTEILLLDEELHEVAPGEEGEICVRGAGLALGYFNDDEKTGQAFIQNPLFDKVPDRIYRTGDLARYDQNGNLVFLGRRDLMIKRSGYRIELGEIEHAVVDGLGLVRNCCVVYDHETRDLIMVYESGQELDTRQVVAKLREKLPKYMLPNKFFWVSEMPRNATGKIDRKLISSQYRDSRK